MRTCPTLSKVVLLLLVVHVTAQVAGALLSMGDAHIAQGDSEFDGTGEGLARDILEKVMLTVMYVQGTHKAHAKAPTYLGFGQAPQTGCLASYLHVQGLNIPDPSSCSTVLCRTQLPFTTDTRMHCP